MVKATVDIKIQAIIFLMFEFENVLVLVIVAFVLNYYDKFPVILIPKHITKAIISITKSITPRV